MEIDGSGCLMVGSCCWWCCCRGGYGYGLFRYGESVNGYAMGMGIEKKKGYGEERL